MRSKYCETSSREVTRPSFMAFCISGIVASTTLNGRRALAGLVDFAPSCPNRLAVVQARKSARKPCFMEVNSTTSVCNFSSYCILRLQHGSCLWHCPAEGCGVKLKELPNFLGLQPGPKSYGFKLKS